MKFTLAFVAALVGAAAAAPYTPPADQPDGAYVVTFDKSGEPITKRVDNAVQATSVKEKRQSFPGQDVVCTDRDIPQDGSYQAVQDCLGGWLDRTSGTFGKGVFYCRSGDTLLAVCNYGVTLYGGSSEIATFNGIMDNQCSAWRSGYVFISDWNKTYWRTTWGETICGNLDAGQSVKS